MLAPKAGWVVLFATDASWWETARMPLTRKQARRFVWLQRPSEAFHVVAWFDCSVPVTRGRLGRIAGMRPSN